MKTVITLLIVAVAFMVSLYRRFKRTLEETGGMEETGGQSFDQPEESDEVEETAFNPYFSYEYVAPKAEAPAEPRKPQPAPAVKPQPVAAAASSPAAFDLRQAVIYQTVLNNPYIDEINQ